jgi:hypothetical protein
VERIKGIHEAQLLTYKDRTSYQLQCPQAHKWDQALCSLRLSCSSCPSR